MAPTLESLTARARDWADRTLDQVPLIRSAVSQIIRVEVLDRSLIIAAQALFALTPLLVVLAAFTSHLTGVAVLDHLSSTTGISQASSPDAVTHTAVASDQVRSQTGVVGLLLVIISALSFARAIQRLFERIWELKHRGGVVGAKRCLLWLAGWIVYLQLLVAVVLAMRGPLHLSVIAPVFQIGAGALVWWWTAHTLLLGRVPWSSLWLGAVLTSLGLYVQVRVSHLIMPQYTQANVDQFGALGIVFAASTWLLVFGGVIVVSATLGRVIVEDPQLGRLITSIRPPKIHRKRVR